ncbi:MAG TPA: hypothetical protein VNJ07_01850 [Chitinophagales bacterium]|nr:hypothetical protein [Chitinophagales bacterium]
MKAHLHFHFPKKENALARFVNKRKSLRHHVAHVDHPAQPCLSADQEFIIGKPVRFYVNCN